MALFLTLVIFAFWVFTGSAVLKVLTPKRCSLAEALLAPAVGIATILLPVFWLNRSGLPVAHFAVFLFFAVLAGGSAAHLCFRTAWPWREYRPFAVLFVIAALLIGWPLLLYGFDWLSFCNNDMTNYSLLAQRFLTHGFFDVPSAEEVLGGKNYDQTFWLQGLVERSGAELLLAWLSALTKLAAPRMFMPLILSFHLSIISVTGALVYSSVRKTAVAWTTCCLLSASPLLTFGALYQLMGQTVGLTMLIACLSVTASMQVDGLRSAWLREAGLFALLLSGLLVVYPEVLPFYVVITAVFAVLQVLRHRTRGALCPAEFWKLCFSFGGALLLLLLVFLQRYLFCAFTFLQRQVHNGVTGSSQATELFHHYLLPSGLAGLWGLMNIYEPLTEPWMSAGIFLGAGLLLFTAAAALWQIRSGNIVFVGVLVMLLGAAFLRVVSSAFGLYKIAMYLQPFLWSALVISWMAYPRSRIIQGGVLFILAVLCARTQWDYADLSRGEPGEKSGAFNEIYNASSTGVYRELEDITRSLHGEHLVLDTNNVVLAKLQAYVLKDVRLTFPFFDIYPAKREKLAIAQAPELEREEQALHDAESGRISVVDFGLGEGGLTPAVNRFGIENRTQPGEDAEEKFALVANTSLQSLMNRRRFSDTQKNFRLVPWEDVRDHLIFIDSSLGGLYYDHLRDSIALYQLEPDYFFPGRTMAGIGRHFVFQVVNPSRQPRMLVEITASLKGDGENALPPAVVVGRSREPFRVMGRGSARLISDPFEPQVVKGRTFVGLDMGASGGRWKENRTGLMRLYGVNVDADPRRLVGFGRNISLLSAEDYDRLDAPGRIEKFPDAFANPNLEYSGAYEDGWLSEDSYFFLKSPLGESALLEICGSIPDLGEQNFVSTFRLSVNGNETFVKNLKPGDFVLQTRQNGSGTREMIKLSFSRWQRLPGGDGRPVAAKVKRLGFREFRNDGADIIEKGDRIVLGRNWHDLEADKKEKFRWVANDAEFLVGSAPHPESKQFSVSLQVEPGPGIESKPFWLDILDDQQRVLQNVYVGKRSDITLTLPADKIENRSVFLHIDEPGQARGADSRILNFRVFAVSFNPSSSPSAAQSEAEGEHTRP